MKNTHSLYLLLTQYERNYNFKRIINGFCNILNSNLRVWDNLEVWGKNRPFLYDLI